MARVMNDGSELQDDLANALKRYCETHGAYWHRFPDTKSARGNFLKSQPGDFMFLVGGTSALIECKSSAVKAKLVTLAWHGDVGKRQLGKHRLWLRSGNPSLYLYGDLISKTYEWHWGSNVIQKVNDPILHGPLKDLPDSIAAIAALATQYKESLHASHV